MPLKSNVGRRFLPALRPHERNEQMSQEKLDSAKNLFFIALAIDMAVTALVAITDFWAVGVLNDIRAGVTEADQSTISYLEFWESFSKIMILTLIGVGLALVRWLDACYGYAKETLKATGFAQEGWKTWGWIVPFMNVFKPYQVIGEIYKAGTADYLGGEEWKKSSGSGMLLVWWIFWVIAHMVIWGIGKQALKSSFNESLTLSQIVSMYYGSVTVCVISLIVAGLWFVVAGSLTRRLLNRSVPVVGSVAPVHLMNTGSVAIDGSQYAMALPSNGGTNKETQTIDYPAPIDEDRIYQQIAEELESGTHDKGLWTRLFAECAGDEKQTKVLYIKQRAERLIAVATAQLEQAAAEQAARSEELERIQRERGGIVDTRLAAAVLDGNWASASRLLREGVKPIGFDENGNSLLSLAEKRGDKQMIQLLESYGAP